MTAPDVAIARVTDDEAGELLTLRRAAFVSEAGALVAWVRSSELSRSSRASSASTSSRKPSTSSRA